MEFQLHIYGPLEQKGDATVIDINPDVTQIRWSSARPGGYTTLEVGLEPDGSLAGMWLPKPIDIRGFHHVEVYAGRQLCWMGQITQPKRVRGQYVAFTAKGYGISLTGDDFQTGSNNTVLTTGGQLLAQAIGALAPNLRVQQLVDTGAAHYQVDTYEMTVADIVNLLVREGGNGSVWDWLVFGQHVVGGYVPAAVFAPRQPPQQAQYHLAWNDITDWTEDFEQMYSAVAVDYTTPTTGGGSPVAGTRKLSVTTQTPSVLQQYGRYRRKLIKGSTWVDGAALQFQETYRVQYSVPAVAAQAQFTDSDDLPGAGGEDRPKYLANAGEWVAVGDWPSLLPIIQTTYDGFSGALTLVLNQYPAGMFQALADANALSAAVVRATNPITGSTTKP
jgi:hypothetical protein